MSMYYCVLMLQVQACRLELQFVLRRLLCQNEQRLLILLG